MVAAPTNPSDAGRPSSPSMAGIGRQIVIQTGGQQAVGGVAAFVVAATKTRRGR